MFSLNQNNRLCFSVVDDFIECPYALRAHALSMTYEADKNYFRGQRSIGKYLSDEIKEEFEKIIHKKITKWDYETNGIFQFCTPEDLLVYHMDSQQYAAILYLTPNAPVECGTSFFKSKSTGIRRCPSAEELSIEDLNTIIGQTFKGGFFDRSRFELVDSIGNVFNRLVVWDAKMIHAASQYFGTCKEDSRLFQVFFFDAE